MTKKWPILDNFWSFLENFWSVLKILVSAENFGLGIFQNLAFYRVAEQKCILNPRAGPPRGPLFGPFLGPLFGSLRSAPIQNHRRTSYQFDGTASDPPKRGSQNDHFWGYPPDDRIPEGVPNLIDFRVPERFWTVLSGFVKSDKPAFRPLSISDMC